MKKLSALAFLGLVGGMWASGNSAWAIKPFADEFIAVYVQPGTPLAEAVEKVKCNVCHEGKSKKDRNVYGQALSELLDKKEDKDNKDKIRAAFETVAAMPSNPDDPNSPTFGDLIKSGKLPGGNSE